MQPITPRPDFLPLTGDGIQKLSMPEQKKQLEGKVEEFATLLYAQMFQQMRESGKSDDEESESIFGGGDTNHFMHFIDQSVGKNFASQGGSGLKEALMRQLTERLETQAQKGGGQ